MVLSASASAMTSVQELEEQLVLEGESPELITELVEGYLLLDDPETATLYLDYLKANFPDYVQSETQQIEAFEASIRATQASTEAGWMRSYQAVVGHDTNASQGTTLSQVDLRLGTGENLVLAVSPESREQASAYGQFVGSFSTQVNDRTVTYASIDVVDYQNDVIDDLVFGSVAVARGNHMAGLYVFDRASTRTGAVYRGLFADWRLGLQADSEQHKVSIDKLVVGQLEGRDVNVEVGAFVTQEPSFGWAGLRGQLRVPLDRLNLRYVIEIANADAPFDPVFFPGSTDRYVWQALRVSAPIQVTEQSRWDLTLDYHQKDHRINVNSWDGLDLKLAFSAAF